MSTNMDRATRVFRGIAAFGAIAFALAAASFLVPQRNVTEIAIAMCFIAAVALALSPLLVTLVVTWRAVEMPLELRRLLTTQSLVLAAFGVMIIWATSGEPVSLAVAVAMLALAAVGLTRARGKAHQWVTGLAGTPNFSRAARVGTFAILLALSHSVMLKFRGMDSEGIELTRLKATLRTIEDAQQAFWQDSGRYMQSLDRIDLGEDMKDSVEMRVEQGTIDLSAKGSRHGGTCTMRIVRAADSAYDTGAFPDCERGPLTRKPVVPGVVLYMLGALLSAWLFWRPIQPLPKSAS